jgi:CRP-like cAMP-binding protein
MADKVTQLEAQIRTMGAYIQQLELQVRDLDKSEDQMYDMAEKMASHKILLSKVPLFMPLTERELLKIASRLRSQTYKDKENIITVGEVGYAMYIVASGAAKAVTDQGVSLKDYETEGFFGELALLNDSPRSATIISIGDTTCLELTRQDFALLKDRCDELMQQYTADYKSHAFKLRVYKQLLQGLKMPLFKSLSDRELLRLAANLRQVEFTDGDHAITQDDMDGHGMYIVETGKAVVSMREVGRIVTLERGDFFGEIALVMDEPRKATVTAEGDATFLELRREDFASFQGEVGEHLREMLAEYKRKTERMKAEQDEARIKNVAATISSQSQDENPVGQLIELWFDQLQLAGIGGEVAANLHSEGVEAVEDLLILAESSDDLVALGIPASSVDLLWSEVENMRKLEGAWLQSQAEQMLEAQRSKEEERNVGPRTALQEAADRRRKLCVKAEIDSDSLTPPSRTAPPRSPTR